MDGAPLWWKVTNRSRKGVTLSGTLLQELMSMYRESHPDVDV
jgi:hypothetical protein